jgi:8-oxo-dGTP diphosphatase
VLPKQHGSAFIRSSEVNWKMKLATLCYLRRNGHTLMLHRNKKENDMHVGKWNGLGGKLENGESPEECAVREIREESGYVAKNPIFRGVITFPRFSNKVICNGSQMMKS